ncbi:MAG: Npt1/Npt2 family nucleotide transporter [Planctomycetota bacterium]
MEDRRTEMVRALACAFLFFLVIGSYYVAKSVRDGILVHDFEAGTVPKLYIAACILTLPIAGIVALLARRWPRQVLIPAAYLACAAVFLAFRMAYARFGAPTSLCAAYFIWASVYNILTICLFWSLTNDLFTKEEGRRVYGIVGAGGILGGAAGGTIASRLAQQLGTAELLPIVAVGLVLCAVLFVVVHYTMTPRGQAVSGETRGAVALRDLGRVFADPYVACIAAFVVLHTFSETTVDLQSKAILKEAGMSRDQSTAFFGSFYAIMNVLALFTQLVVTTLVHRRWGPRPGLLVLPVATLLLGPLLLWTPPARTLALPLFGTISLQAAVIAAVGIPLMAFAYSIKQSSKELLYVPTDASVKFQAKPIIDTFGFRLGDTLTSLLALLAGSAGVARVKWFAAVGYAGCLVWIVLAWRVGGMWHGRRAATAPASGTPGGP